MVKVLVCDDDKAILKSIAIYLKQEGYAVLEAANGAEAVALAETEDIRCAVIDIMMPVMDGITAVLKIREKHNFPIIFLSAKSEDTDKIAGLGFGADDYVTKPFNPLELMARIKSQIRRYSSLGALQQTEDILTSGGLQLDTRKKAVFVDGEEVKLTAREYLILEFLMKNMGVIFTSSQIYEAVWQQPSFAPEKTVTVHIRNIREKIEINPKEPNYLKVVYGLGYKIEKH